MNFLGKFTALAALALATTALGSCDSMFHDDLADCPQGVYVRFYQNTSCGLRNKVVGKVNNLHVLAFNKQTGVLANYVAADGVTNLTADYQTLLPLHQGDYELVAWSGNANEFAAAKLQKGVTKKSDAFFQLRQQQDKSLVFPNTPEPLRVGFAGTGMPRLAADSAEVNAGVYPQDEVISIPDPAKFGSVFKHAAINLREQALRLRVNVIVDASVRTSKYPTTPEKFALTLLTGGQALNNEMVNSANTTLTDWKFPQAKLVKSSELLPLMPYHQGAEKDTLVSEYHLLGRTANQLADGRLILTHNGNEVSLSPKLEKAVGGLSLPALIRLEAEKKNINLDCSDGVTIELRVKNACEDCNTYMVYQINITEWAAHSYQVHL